MFKTDLKNVVYFLCKEGMTRSTKFRSEAGHPSIKVTSGQQMVILNKNNRILDVFGARTGHLWHKFGYFKHIICENVAKHDIYMEYFIRI